MQHNLAHDISLKYIYIYCFKFSIVDCIVCEKVCVEH